MGYDVLRIIEKQLMNFTVQYIRLKDDVQRVMKKLLRLQNQKKM